MIRSSCYVGSLTINSTLALSFYVPFLSKHKLVMVIAGPVQGSVDDARYLRDDYADLRIVIIVPGWAPFGVF